MTVESLVVLVVLTGAVGLFVAGRLRVDLVAVLVLLALALTGLVTPAEAVGGFSSPAVVTICGVFILSAGLQRTGVANALGRWVERLGGRSEARLVLALMVSAAALSFFMNTMAIVALFLPAVMDLTRRTGLAPSRLLMPLTFGALLGGLTTMFATLPNLLASAALKEAGLRPFGVFDFLPVGGAAAVVGILFMALLGRRLLPVSGLHQETPALRGLNLREAYALHERMFVLRLPPGGALDGRTLEQTRLGSALGLHVVGILREDRTHLAPDRTTRLRAHDRLLVQGTPDQLNDLEAWRGLRVGESGAGIEVWPPAEMEFAEVQLADGSGFVDQTLPWIDARRSWGVTILAIRRGAQVYRSRLQEQRLQPGDVLLVQGPHDRIQALGHRAGLQGLRSLSRGEIASAYDLQSRLFTLEIPDASPLAEHTLAQSRLGETLGLTVLALSRAGQKVVMPGPQETLRAGDALLVEGRAEDLLALQGLQDLQIEWEVAPNLPEFESEQLGLMEAVLSPRTALAGKSLRQLRFRDRYGLTVMGVWHAGKANIMKLRDATLQFGDALLLYGPREKLKLLAQDPDFIVLTQAMQESPVRAKAPLAVLAVLVFLGLSASSWMPVYVAALTAAALMVLGGCLRLEDAYAAVEWPAVILIGGMLPLAAALDHTGAAAWMAGTLIGSLQGASPVLILASLFIITALAACVIPSAAVVVLLAPIAFETAAKCNLPPHAAMMTVALAAASAFNSPVSHPSNVLIMGPGGYRFVDFLKVGPLLTLLVLTVVLVVLPWVWPLTGP
ncbi:MAG: SLC13 family permease [Verrucomicrobiales bacterium]|nr:SLC13 family permease [Verrucomicrobiales bacterium]